MSKFSRAKKILSLIVGLTNLGSFNVSARKRGSAKKPGVVSVASKAKKNSKKEQKKKAPKKLKNENSKGKKATKDKKLDANKKIENLKKPVQNKSFDLQKDLSRIRKRTSYSNPVIRQYWKNGKWQWTPTSIGTIAVLGTVATGVTIYLGYKMVNGRKVPVGITAGQLNDLPADVTVVKDQNGNPILVDNNVQLPKAITNSDNNNANKVNKQNNEVDAQMQQKREKFQAAQKLVLEAYKKDKLDLSWQEGKEEDYIPHAKMALIAGKFSTNDGKGYGNIDNTQHHGKRMQHNLKLADPGAFTGEQYQMSANEFEVVIALELLKGIETNENLTTLAGNNTWLTFGKEGHSFSLNLKNNKGALNWKVGKDFGIGVTVKFGDSSYENTSGGIFIGNDQRYCWAKSGVVDATNTENAYVGLLQSAFNSMCNDPSNLHDDWMIHHVLKHNKKGGRWYEAVKWAADNFYGKHEIKVPGKLSPPSIEKQVNNIGCDLDKKINKGKKKEQQTNKNEKLSRDALIFAQAIAMVRSFAGQISTAVNCQTKYGFFLTEGNSHYLTLMLASMLDGMIAKSYITTAIDLAFKFSHELRIPDRLPDYGIGTLYKKSGNQTGAPKDGMILVE